MQIIQTADRASLSLSTHDSHQVYNGMDVLMTSEIFQVMEPQLDPNTRKMYEFEKQLQAPVLYMSQRGIKVDQEKRKVFLATYRAEKERLQTFLNQLAITVWDAPLNPDSPAQLQKFFYGCMGIPEIKSRKGKKYRVSTDREALEKIALHLYARPIVTLILALRDATGAVETLERGVDSDNRYRCSYNIAGTETFRFSSSKTLFGTGGNFQNLAPRLRDIFESDPGMKIAYIDLEQAESRGVGLIARTAVGLDNYLKSCSSADLHTTVCKMTWPGLGWTGDAKQDREIADRKFYRDFSYRELAKRTGHGCLTEDHEVLTPEGWVSISEKPTYIATPYAGLCYPGVELATQFTKVSQWTEFLYTGYLYEVNIKGLSINMSDKHRVAYYNVEGQGKYAVPTRSTAESLWRMNKYVKHNSASEDEVIFHTRRDMKKRKVCSVPVWCPTVAGEMFYVRRNGQVYASMNSNYGGSPPAISQVVKVDKSAIEEFQFGYFKAFPEIPEWHRWVLSELRSNGSLTNPFGARRQFFGRLEDKTTINAAIAYGPQSLVANMLNAGMLRIFELQLSGAAPIQLLAQIHDAVIVQYPEELEAEILPTLIACLEAPLDTFPDFSIPADCASGWNWGKGTERWEAGKVYRKGTLVAVPGETYAFKALAETDKEPGGADWCITSTFANPNGIKTWKLPGDARKKW